MVMSRPRRILIAYSMSSTYTPTTLEYLLALKNFSDYEVEYIHVTHDARMDFDINQYDVLFHNYCARLCFEGYVSPHYEAAVQCFRGLKIVSVQDDYDRTATLHRAIRRLGFQVLLTCIQREFWPLAYPRAELPGLAIIQGLTGYMPERLLSREFDFPPLAERKVWVAYRGRDLGAKYGRLGFEKFDIGARIRALCESRGIAHDIAMDADSRIYGDDWFRFLGSSRTMLGSESGSNAFDFDGKLEQAIEAFRRQHGRDPGYEEFRHVLDPLEAPFDVGQISPRIFEYAVAGTPMILFRGRYSGAVEPGEHYIPLEKDFSNADEVLAAVGNLDLLAGLAARAYERLVTSGQYGYRSLARLIEDAIETQYPLWVDPAWVRYRAETARPWMPRPLPAEPASEAEARSIAFAEQPTSLPLGAEMLQARFARYKELAEGVQPVLPPPAAPVPRSLLWRSARTGWRLLPMPVRQQILKAHARLRP